MDLEGVNKEERQKLLAYALKGGIEAKDFHGSIHLTNWLVQVGMIKITDAPPHGTKMIESNHKFVIIGPTTEYAIPKGSRWEKSNFYEMLELMCREKPL